MAEQQSLIDEADLPARSQGWRIALIVNVKGAVEWGPEAPPDAGAEFDSPTTVTAIRQALEADGHQVTVCAGDHTLPANLLALQPDICFNIAEGVWGDAREAQVPALCELLGIPYTASRVLANALSLDKTQTKRIWQQQGLPTAGFQEFQTADEPLNPALRFPLFVKPAREGTGMGMNNDSIVYDEVQLQRQVAWVIAIYQQPALVEEYLSGREFTVGFIGNPGVKSERQGPDFYDRFGYHFWPILEIDTSETTSPGVYGHQVKILDLTEQGAPAYLCPADIPILLQERLVTLSRQAAELLGVCDVARVDLRLDSHGVPHLLEINTLPGLNPAVSDICIMARAEEVPYQVIISEILYLAAERFDLS